MDSATSTDTTKNMSMATCGSRIDPNSRLSERRAVGLLPAGGSNATKRRAIVHSSNFPDCPTGNLSISDANLRVAISFGKPVRMALSCHGSTSCRASTERTVRVISFFSSPIGANNKPSNSRWSGETEPGRAISITGFHRSIKRVEAIWGMKHCRLYPQSNRIVARRDRSGSEIT